jgi:hypothetical protein
MVINLETKAINNYIVCCAMSINADWHTKNRMPKNPKESVRLEWHIEHMKNCDCRKPTPKLEDEIKKYLGSK